MPDAGPLRADLVVHGLDVGHRSLLVVARLLQCLAPRLVERDRIRAHRLPELELRLEVGLGGGRGFLPQLQRRRAAPALRQDLRRLAEIAIGLGERAREVVLKLELALRVPDLQPGRLQRIGFRSRVERVRHRVGPDLAVDARVGAHQVTTRLASGT
jgi:hypothetical protein